MRAERRTLPTILTCLLVALALVSCQPGRFSQWELVAQGFDFPEGPAWDGRALYVSNCYGGWIARLGPGEVDTLALLPEPYRTNGLALGPDGALYACEFGSKAVVKFTEGGTLQVVTHGPEGMPFHRPNDLAFDGAGRLYVTDPKTYDREAEDGRIVCVEVTSGRAWVAASGLAFPNGIAFSPRDGKLYVSESARQRVVRFSVGPDGALGEQQVFVQLPGGDPDGLAFDAHGNLYVAHFGAGEVVVVAPDGNVIARLDAPGKRPTNLEFGGKNLRVLFLTEAGTNSVYMCKTRVPGARLPWVSEAVAR
ncbi:MAG: SMP-30/gluconolactonase/LRE family protein [candidate division KSB1 bacterium]|nr:SMP-30/gluconolactonase/LRE family protein [candidate division KSB1 bacterium]